MPPAGGDSGDLNAHDRNGRGQSSEHIGRIVVADDRHIEDAGLEERRVLHAGGRANALRRVVLALRKIIGVDRRTRFAGLDFLPLAEQRRVRRDPPTVGVAAIKIRE